MDKVFRLGHKSFGLEAPQVPQLLQALKDAKLPATQSAIRRISERKTVWEYGIKPPTEGNRADQTTAPHASINSVYAERFLRSLATSLQAWRCQLPPHIQPALLALVDGSPTIDVQSIAFCAPDFVHLSGSCEGSAYRLLAPLSRLQFVCMPNASAAAPSGIRFELGNDVFDA